MHEACCSINSTNRQKFSVSSHKSATQRSFLLTRSIDGHHYLVTRKCNYTYPPRPARTGSDTQPLLKRTSYPELPHRSVACSAISRCLMFLSMLNCTRSSSVHTLRLICFPHPHIFQPRVLLRTVNAPPPALPPPLARLPHLPRLSPLAISPSSA